MNLKRISCFNVFESLAPRIVEFIAELHSITVMEGEDATFKCVVAPEDAKVVWCMNGCPVTSNERLNISSNGLCHMLHISDCQVSDSCKLTAEAEGVISKATLQVQGGISTIILHHFTLNKSIMFPLLQHALMAY